MFRNSHALPPSRARRCVIVGNPGCRRVARFQAALAQRGWQPARVVAYADLLLRRTRLAEHLAPGCLVRIESAAEDWGTRRLLLEHGIKPAITEGYPAANPKEIAAVPCQRGLVLWPRQLFLGFARLLDSLSAELETCAASAMTSPRDIVLLFDKPRCQSYFRDAGVPVPRMLGLPKSYQQLREWCGRDGRFMLKLAHGSGGAGCAAVHWQRGRARAFTTLVLSPLDGRNWTHCSKRAHHVRDESEIASIVDWLCGERAHVEEWLPKATLEGQGFDLRIVTIGGVPRHAVPRLSLGPFTNLNLGNQRGDLAAALQRLGDDTWQAIRQTCARVAASLAQSLYLGIDVLVTPDRRRHFVLEANAFGDFLQHVVHNGLDTYSAEIAALEN